MDGPLFGFLPLRAAALSLVLAACAREPEPSFPPSNQPYSGYPQQAYPQQSYAQQPPQRPQPPRGDASLDDARQYNLFRVNGFRARAGRAPLRLDDGINAFSQAASQELSQDHTPHRYFQTNWSACACRINAENQGDWNGVPPAPVHDQIDQMLNLMIGEGPGGGHYENMLSAKWTRMGAGIVNPGGTMYFTNDFGP